MHGKCVSSLLRGFLNDSRQLTGMTASPENYTKERLMDRAIFKPGRQHVRQARRDRNGPSLGTHHTPLSEAIGGPGRSDAAGQVT